MCTRKVDPVSTRSWPSGLSSRSPQSSRSRSFRRQVGTGGPREHSDLRQVSAVTRSQQLFPGAERAKPAQQQPCHTPETSGLGLCGEQVCGESVGQGGRAACHTPHFPDSCGPSQSPQCPGCTAGTRLSPLKPGHTDSTAPRHPASTPRCEDAMQGRDGKMPSAMQALEPETSKQK